MNFQARARVDSSIYRRARLARTFHAAFGERFVSPCVKTRITVGARLLRLALGGEVIWIYRTADRPGRAQGGKRPGVNPTSPELMEPQINGAMGHHYFC